VPDLAEDEEKYFVFVEKEKSKMADSKMVFCYQNCSDVL
jgi:hypothetical protein